MAAKSDYHELRLKTDRQLIHLANTELELGICDARQALESAENWASAKSHYLMAEIAYAQTARLIHFISDVGEDELRGVKSRLAHLREVLEGLSVLGGTSAPNADRTSSWLGPCGRPEAAMKSQR